MQENDQKKQPKLIDTHTHMCDQAFDTDRDNVLADAETVNIQAVFTVSETLDDAVKNLELSRNFFILKPLAGLFPGRTDDRSMDSIENFIRKHRHFLAGIGEIGLDYWKGKTERERAVQSEHFRRFVMLSRNTGLPMNIHSRSAGRHVINILLEMNAERVQLHAFDGKASTALPAIEAGYFFSIPPSIVRSRQKQKLIKRLPLSCLLLESDSPVLGPDPYMRNTPTQILRAAEAISEIKGVALDDVLSATFDNTVRLYGPETCNINRGND